MQPISTNTITPQANTSISKQTQQPAKLSNKPKTNNAHKLPEDIVSLSNSSMQKQVPSNPVSNKEKDALLNQSSDYKSISYYA